MTASYKRRIAGILSLLISSSQIVVPPRALSATELNSRPEIESQAGGGKFALLIGINTYKNAPSPNNLSGAENDVRLVSGLLQSKEFGFDRINGVKELLSLAATKTAILDSIDSHLITNAKRYYSENRLTNADKGATIVFHYSGHGSYLKDDEVGEEADGQDETIVPSDASLLDPNSEIRDDELNEKFQELRKFTTNITLIFDSCHSGTITRASLTGDRNDVAERRWTKGDRSSSVVRREGVSLVPDSLRGGIAELSEGYVAVAGSLPNELTQEINLPIPGGDGLQKQKYGLLTYYFTQVLYRNPRSSYRDLMLQVKAAVTGHNPLQHPHIEGDIDRLIFTTVTSGSRKNPIKILHLETVSIGQSDGEVADVPILKIDAGRIVGAYPGGHVAIYSPVAVQMTGETDRIAGGEIIAADAFTAKVQVSTPVKIPPDAKLILATPFFGLEKMPIALDITESPSSASLTSDSSVDRGLKMINELESSLGQDSYVTTLRQANPLLPANKEKWAVALVRAKFSDFLKGNIQPQKRGAGYPGEAEEIYYLSNKSGSPLYNFYVKPTDEKAIERITAALQSLVRIRNLEAINNAAADTGKALTIELVRVKEIREVLTGNCDERIIAMGEKARERDRETMPQLNPGDKFYFEITNRSTVPLYPYLYSLGTDGSVSMLFPIRGTGHELLKGGQTMKLPQASRCTAYQATPVEKTVEGKTVLNPAPYGSETFKLIGSTQPFDGELLESPTVAGLVMNGNIRGYGPLGQLFARATTNRRGTQLAPPSFKGWVTSTLTVELVPKTPHPNQSLSR